MVYSCELVYQCQNGCLVFIDGLNEPRYMFIACEDFHRVTRQTKCKCDVPGCFEPNYKAF